VTDQFRFQTIALSGIGIAGPGVSLTPVSLSFPATGVGLTALAQTLTLTNNGGLPLSISSVVASPGFTLAANTCGTSLAVNAACTLTVVFAPTAAGPVSGALTFTDNGPSGTQATTLSGTGIDFALTATGATSATIAGSGASTTYALQLSSLTGLSGNVALSCSGAPANSTCTGVPGVTSLGTTTPIAVTVETDVATAALVPPAKPFSATAGAKTILLALLLPLALCTRRRRNARFALALALMYTLAALSGCGASRTIPNVSSPGNGTPTPTGTYTLTVSASAAGLTHSVNLTLIVQ
jgi:hypothetical protein